MSQELPVVPPQAGLAQLNERSREIFRQIVESYLATGEPVGSRNLARIIPMTLSPASVRNVMADLEHAGLRLCAAHLGRPAADRAGPALLRRCADADRRSHRERPQGDRGAGRRRRHREVGGIGAQRCLRHAVRTVPRGRRRAGGEVEHAAQAHRVRAARARARPGGAGLGGRAGREPHPRPAARAADLGAVGSHQLPQRAHPRPHAAPRRASSSSARSRRARPSSISSPSASCRRALRAGRAARARSAS